MSDQHGRVAEAPVQLRHVVEVHPVDAGDHRRHRERSRPRRRSCACPRSGAPRPGSGWPAGRCRAARGSRRSGSLTRRRWSWTSRKYSCSSSGSTSKWPRGELVDGVEPAAPPRAWKLEHLALELVDPLGRVGAVGREDLRARPRWMSTSTPCGDVVVAVDDVVEDRVEDRARARARAGRGGCSSRVADRRELALAVADGDDEVGVDEEQHLADLDHLVGVDVAGGLDDDEDRVTPASCRMRPAHYRHLCPVRGGSQRAPFARPRSRRIHQ